MLSLMFKENQLAFSVSRIMVDPSFRPTLHLPFGRKNVCLHTCLRTVFWIHQVDHLVVKMRIYWDFGASTVELRGHVAQHTSGRPWRLDMHPQDTEVKLTGGRVTIKEVVLPVAGSVIENL